MPQATRNAWGLWRQRQPTSAAKAQASCTHNNINPTSPVLQAAFSCLTGGSNQPEYLVVSPVLLFAVAYYHHIAGVAVVRIGRAQHVKVRVEVPTKLLPSKANMKL